MTSPSVRLTRIGGSALAAAFLLALVVWPMVALIFRSFDPALSDGFVETLAVVLGKPSTRSTVAFTLAQAAASTALTVVAGLPVALVIARYSFRGRAALRAFVVVPFVMPTMVVAAAFDAAIGDVAPPLVAVLAAHVFFNLAVIVRVVGGHWARIDPAAADVARVLGASPAAAWRTITLPQLVPALASASLLVFLFSFTSFGIVRALGGLRMATVETEIHRYAVARQQFDVAAILALIQILFVALIVVAQARLQRSHERGSVAVDEATARRAATVVTGGWRRLTLASALGLVAVLQGLPVALLIERSLKVGSSYGLANYAALASRPDVLPASALRALANSLLFAAVAVAVVVGVAVAALAPIRAGGRVGRGLEALSMVPLGVSAVTLGFGYLVGFARFDLRSSWLLVPLAHAVIGLPFMLASLGPAARAIDDRLRQAAAVLGAGPARVALSVDWPYLRGALTAGAGLAAAVSVGEFGATSFLARGDRTFTAPLAIFRLLGTPGEVLRGQAMALSVIVALLVGTIALAVEFNRDDLGGAL